MKNLSQYSRCPGRDSNRTPPEYKPEVLQLQPYCSLLLLVGQDISVGIATGYETHGRGTILGKGSVQTGSGVHPASYTMDTGSSFSGVKAAWS
jgi:hypothetical protein